MDPTPKNNELDITFDTQENEAKQPSYQINPNAYPRDDREASLVFDAKLQWPLTTTLPNPQCLLRTEDKDFLYLMIPTVLCSDYFVLDDRDNCANPRVYVECWYERVPNTSDKVLIVGPVIHKDREPSW